MQLVVVVGGLKLRSARMLPLRMHGRGHRPCCCPNHWYGMLSHGKHSEQWLRTVGNLPAIGQIYQEFCNMLQLWCLLCTEYGSCGSQPDLSCTLLGLGDQRPMCMGGSGVAIGAVLVVYHGGVVTYTVAQRLLI
jgi:hypothetical protein